MLDVTAGLSAVERCQLVPYYLSKEDPVRFLLFIDFFDVISFDTLPGHFCAAFVSIYNWCVIPASFAVVVAYRSFSLATSFRGLSSNLLSVT